MGLTPPPGSSSPGCSPSLTPGVGVKALKFLNQFYAYGGARKTFDVLSLHPYSVSARAI